jgi:citrate synthase
VRQKSSFLSELPSVPDPAVDACPGMPPSTGVFANPVRYEQQVACNGTSIELRIRSYGLRGCLLEEDIVAGSADAIRVMFVGLFGRFPKPAERNFFLRLIAREFELAVERVVKPVAAFLEDFPDAPADLVMQHLAVLRKAAGDRAAINASIPAADLLRNLIRVHLENVAAGACASHMRTLPNHRRVSGPAGLVRQTKGDNPFRPIFSLLLHRETDPTEDRILETLGTIQIHHGSAGSNMVARYLASLHTRSVSDLFTASHMTLDCARHFGAITDLTDFVRQVERAARSRWDELIRQRMARGNLPTFGHPEIAVAGRDNSFEFDPRPAIYLFPLFEAIDAGKVKLSSKSAKRIEILQRMYQLAFVEGLEKPGRSGRLRVAPNTDFGGWIVQEALGIDERDRTFLSYVFRGFGWMMDVREQLQQPIIRPVIAPDPHIVPPPAQEGIIADVVASVHRRLCEPNAFSRT